LNHTPETRQFRIEIVDDLDPGRGFCEQYPAGADEGLAVADVRRDQGQDLIDEFGFAAVVI